MDKGQAIIELGVNEPLPDDLSQGDVGEGRARGRFDEGTMAQPQLTHAAGDDVDQQLLIRDHLSCFLQELSGHISQGTDGAGGIRRKLKNGRCIR